MHASGVEPPDTDLLEWGATMGTNEFVCQENVSRALEAAIAAGELHPANGAGGSRPT